MLAGESVAAAAAAAPGAGQALEQEPHPQSPPLPPRHRDLYSSCLVSASHDAPCMTHPMESVERLR